ncbi:DUF6468 domain-containing protein [Caulobacter mirabilis]|uniref:Flagellar positioning protein PflI n=1 Tax=Caulobacter mirabilis TaxID=69666 RepID=A0A2D2B0C2_9CAUL|nr:DUF6468 domain-containing protein [Caulobacter mirabilis]ATQ43708.1 flagellar positioning protein PflI [Caulobacter mirabilis]
MSAAVAILNVVLVALLLAALAFGWRLERKLKALKDSQEGFAKAVADLDAAAARAEQGLADLRAFTDEASDTLAARIESAKALADQLEAAATQGAAMPERRAAPPPPMALRERPVDAFVRRDPVTTPRSRARVDDDLFEPDADGNPFRTATGARR